MQGILMDGRLYQVRVVYNTLERSFSLRSGVNEGYMVSDRHERDLLGTAYSYELAVEPNPANPGDYDAFYEAISAPVNSHEVTLPYGQSTITFQAEIAAGTDRWGGRLAGVDLWSGLKVKFTPISLQRPVS